MFIGLRRNDGRYFYHDEETAKNAVKVLEKQRQGDV